MHGATQSVTAELGVDPIPVRGRDFADSGGDVTEPTSGHRRGDTCVEGSLRRLDERPVGRVGAVADDDRDRSIGDPAVDRHREVQGQHVAITQHVIVWHPMEHGIVDR